MFRTIIAKLSNTGGIRPRGSVFIFLNAIGKTTSKCVSLMAAPHHQQASTPSTMMAPAGFGWPPARDDSEPANPAGFFHAHQRRTRHGIDAVSCASLVGYQATEPPSQT
jgi:hypothetical protein